MAQKILGYIQLIWTCPFCQTQNPGAIKSCTSCGAPQPKDIQFEKVDMDKFNFIKDEALIRMAKSGPDKHCPYCGTRNLSTDTRCSQCGSDITIGADSRKAGERIEPQQSSNIPDVDIPTVSQEPKKLSKGCIIGLVVFFVIACIISIVVFINLNKTESYTGTVDSVYWKRSYSIEAYTTVQSEDWYENIPSNADIGYCTSAYHYTSDSYVANATEVCGEPYTVDTGTGIGEVRQDCVYRVYDDYCEYSVITWTIVDTLTMSGYDLQPRWPNFVGSSTERIASQSEEYKIQFSSSDGKKTYTTSDVDLYLRAIPGSTWELEINGFGDVVDASPN